MSQAPSDTRDDLLEPARESASEADVDAALPLGSVLQPAAPDTRVGMLLALGASLAFSLMNALAKSCHLPAGEVAFSRGAVGFLVTVLWMRSAGVSFVGARPRVLWLRGLLGGVSLYLNFTALQGLQLADATFLSHSSSLFVVVFGVWFLGERLPRSFYALFAVALAGVAMIVQPQGAWNGRELYALYGLGSALTAAGASLSIRSLSKDHHTLLIMLYFMGAAALVPLAVDARSFVLPGGADVLRLLALSGVSYLGQYLLTRAYTFKEAAVVSLTRFAGVGFNVGLGLLIWHELPSRWSALGGCLILGACATLYRLEAKKK